jgi:hypothetical protein
LESRAEGSREKIGESPISDFFRRSLIGGRSTVEVKPGTADFNQ